MPAAVQETVDRRAELDGCAPVEEWRQGPATLASPGHFREPDLAGRRPVTSQHGGELGPYPEKGVSLDALLQGVDEEVELLLDGLLAHSAAVTHVDDRSSTETCSRFSRRNCRVLQSCAELHDGVPVCPVNPVPSPDPVKWFLIFIAAASTLALFEVAVSVQLLVEQNAAWPCQVVQQPSSVASDIRAVPNQTSAAGAMTPNAACPTPPPSEQVNSVGGVPGS